MITISFAIAEDIPVIQKLAEKIWPVTYEPIIGTTQVLYMLALFYNAERLNQQMNIEGHQFIIYFQNEQPIGFASFNEYRTHYWKLQKIYILPSQQGNGIGKALIDFIIRHIEKQNAIALDLNVNRQNSAIAFYKKHNFEIIAQEDIDIGSNYFMNDYVMRRKLFPVAPNSDL